MRMAVQAHSDALAKITLNDGVITEIFCRKKYFK